MPQSVEEKIRELCDSWIAAQQPGQPGHEWPEQYRLHKNEIIVPNLTYNEIQTMCTSLSRVLLLKGLNTFIDFDHKLFWAWTGEMILSPMPKLFASNEESKIRHLFSTCIRAALVGTLPPGLSWEEWRREVELSRPGEFNAQQLVENAHEVLAYLVFPLLESMLKKICNHYVDFSGNVLAPFKKGPTRLYEIGDKCSSLRDLLHLLYEIVSDSDLRPRIDEMRLHLLNLDNSCDPFELIYSWRNSSLHGSSSYPTIGGTVLNFVSLIAFNQIRLQYISRRDEVNLGVQREQESRQHMRSRSPWSYYPPY